MNQLVVMLLGFLLVHALYISALTEHASRLDRTFADAGGYLPGWAVVFASGGVLLSGIGLVDHLSFIGQFGLQYSHTAMGLLLAAMTAVLVQKRLWIAGRIAHLGTPGEAFGQYYQSVVLRIVMIALAVLFALPFAATILSQLGQMVSYVTAGQVSRPAAIWIVAFFLFLASVVGGWRATILVIAIQSALVAALFVFVTGFVEFSVAGNSFLSGGIQVSPGNLADTIPGVIQYSAGIGKSIPQGGIFTTIGIASTALSFIGLVLSPAHLYLSMTSAPGKSFAFGAVWIVSGLAAGLLLIMAPILAARLGPGTQGVFVLFSALGLAEPLAAGALVLLLAASAMISVSFFVTAGAILVNSELVFKYMLPGAGAQAAKLSARIVIAIAFVAAAALSTFAPISAAILGALALPLAVQLLPAILGLALVPWISRSAIITGLIFGGMLVIFTEAAGITLVEGLLVKLPWGRWPLTIHSAAWGLAFNFGAVLLVSIFTRTGLERDHRDRLHREFADRWTTNFGGPAARGAKWSLALIWAFLAIGPGAILGNSFFVRPFFTEGEKVIGIPSLWAWQLLFWPIGVMLVWWIAYRSGLGSTTADGLRRVDLSGPRGDIGARRAPAWIARSIERLTER